MCDSDPLVMHDKEDIKYNTFIALNLFRVPTDSTNYVVLPEFCPGKRVDKFFVSCFKNFSQKIYQDATKL